ncbi:unnamed protein product (macronuclear) [Paramecium tetraurelia]|uniref:Transmembrane protein n=1 Tax=Paramecium tetraurelia TaxID=5888 RepID=A0DSM1_PARTE|nr:uncharacterized protein GSPATT00039743001 [Paramecium tetraurelia]CAK86038.1 unnamed protein product [Paramecium tetraurelia]|eukprot:XP_001453435.1 hypothetical protein (macronuclear) [Paramecium tetraurelia strain d4-2]
MTYFESNILLKAALLGSPPPTYQILAGRQQPYSLSKLNKLRYLSSVNMLYAIFIAIAKYVSEQQVQNASSQILQVFHYASLYQTLLLVYFRNLQIICQEISVINRNCDIQSFEIDQTKIEIKWRRKEKRVQQNFSILKAHLSKIANAQIKTQKQHYQLTRLFCNENPKQNLASLTRQQEQTSIKAETYLNLEN